MYVINADMQVAAVSDIKRSYWSNSETSLANWWFRQAVHESRLRTTEGEMLILLSTGHLNDGPGPDVLDVHLILGDLEQSGNVEFHRQGRDWYRHGHSRDPSYESVILHVVGADAGGPDLPTLLVDVADIGHSPCIALRPIQPDELLQAAWYRFKTKSNHITALEEVATEGLNALWMGMIEILCAGPNRFQMLQRAAQSLGLVGWPEARSWSGSLRQMPWKKHSIIPLQLLTDFAHLFRTENWLGSDPALIHDWHSLINPFESLGVSQAHFREWVINILGPSWGDEQGFQLWLNLPPFRSYGFEKTLRVNLGLRRVASIAEQQALIWWKRELCQANACHKCPLSHIH